MKKRYAAICALFLALITLIAFTEIAVASGREAVEEGKGPIVVASKIDTEGALLGQMIIHMLNASGFETVDKVQFGTTDVIRKAIFSGEIDLYPEYTGTGLLVLLDPEKHMHQRMLRDENAVFYYVKGEFRERYGLEWLSPVGFNNTYALMMRARDAQRFDIKTISDLKVYVDQLERNN